MALFKILKGVASNLPSTITEGQMYVTTDEPAIYVDTDSSTRVKVANAAPATNSVYGEVKTNTSEDISLNSSGQLIIGGRLGQAEGEDGGFYSPRSAPPASIGERSLLITDAIGVTLGNKSLGIYAGSAINLKNSAPAGSTTYSVSNTYANRIACYSLALTGAIATKDLESAATRTSPIISVTIDGQPFTPDSSADNSSKNIIITTESSINPDAATSTIRVYPTGSGASNLYLGQAVGGNGTCSVVIGQRVFSESGNANILIGGSIYNNGSGNAIFGRQHINKKGRVFLTGTGHDTTNAKDNDVAVMGKWSNISSDTAFAVGNGTSQTNRLNILELKSNGRLKLPNTAVTDDEVPNKSGVATLISQLALERQVPLVEDWNNTPYDATKQVRFYYAAAGLNAPSGCSAIGGIEISKGADIRTQVVSEMYAANPAIYVRNCFGGSWGTWKKVVLE